MKKKQFNTLLDATYELEGLLSLALSRNGAPGRITELIISKAYEIADIATGLQTQNDTTDSTDIPTPVSSTQTTEASAEKEDDKLYSENMEIEKDEDSISTQIPSTEPGAFDILSFVQDIPLPEPEEKTNQEEFQPTDYQELQYDSIYNSEPETTDKKDVSVYDRPLKTFFSLNDKFRFRRELFNGSDSEFNKSLSLIEELGNITDAENYLYNELGLDQDMDAVKEFFSIISRFYQ